jgi:hypothetical protein
VCSFLVLIPRSVATGNLLFVLGASQSRARQQADTPANSGCLAALRMTAPLNHFASKLAGSSPANRIGFQL